jgi:hypothetical protein
LTSRCSELRDPRLSVSDSAAKVPLKKNPWFWAALACLIFPPMIRPFTRNIVEAPEPSSGSVSLDLSGPGARSFGNAQLEERIHIAVFVDASAPGCPEAVAAIRPLVERMDVQAYAGRGLLARTAGFGEDIRVLVVAGFPAEIEIDLGGLEGRCGMDTDRWVLAGGDLGEVLALGAALEGRPGEATTFLTHRRMTIIDTERRARGLYALDEPGLDEVYHRARHILRDDRIATRDSPQSP